MPSKKVAPVMPKSRSLAVEAEPGEAHDHAQARVAISPHFDAGSETVVGQGRNRRVMLAS